MSEELRVGFAEQIRTQIYNLARRLESLQKVDTPMEELKSIITPFERACSGLRQTLDELHKKIDTLNPKIDIPKTDIPKYKIEDIPAETPSNEMLIKLKSNFNVRQISGLSCDALREFNQKQVTVTAGQDVVKGYFGGLNVIRETGGTRLKELRIYLRDRLTDEKPQHYIITPDADHHEVKIELGCN